MIDLDGAHRENVLLLNPSSDRPNEPILEQWMERLRWLADRGCCYRESISPRPLEQGYLRCLHVITGNTEIGLPSINMPMDWSETRSAESTSQLLSQFID